MGKDDNNIPLTEILDLESERPKKSDLSSTMVEISPKASFSGIPPKQHAFLELIDPGEEKNQMALGEGRVIIGRAPDCDIRLSVQNVSRKHALVVFRNEEYHLEDLGSTNGVYVNGIKVEKCILRSHDQIDIGVVKFLFHEAKIRQKP